MNSCLFVDDMFVHVNWTIKCYWYWIHVSKIIYMNMLCFCEKWWIMKLWFDELGMNSWLIVVVDVWKHVVDEFVWWICHWWIDDESCCCCWIILKVWWNFEVRQKWCLIHEFLAFLCLCLCTWPINLIWDEFWVWEDQNWSVGENGFWNSKFIFLEWWVFA